MNTCNSPGCITSDPTHAITVIGFLQAFIEGVGLDGNPPDVRIKILNVVGCSQTPNANRPMTGGNGASAIPVRLITPP